MNRNRLIQVLINFIRLSYKKTNDIKVVNKFMTDPIAVVNEFDDQLKIYGSIINTFYQALLVLNFSDRSTNGSITETKDYFMLSLPALNATIQYHLDKSTFEVIKYDYSSDIIKQSLACEEEVKSFLNSDDGLDLINEIKRNFPEIDITGPGTIINDLNKQEE